MVTAEAGAAMVSKPMHAAVRRVLRQAWELDDANKAEKLIRNLARRLEHDAPGVSASILEGLDEILTVTRLGLTGGHGGPDRGIDPATSSTTPMQRCARNGSASARTGTTIRRQVDGVFTLVAPSSTIRIPQRSEKFYVGGKCSQATTKSGAPTNLGPRKLSQTVRCERAL
jgi:hypothetical protein